MRQIIVSAILAALFPCIAQPQGVSEPSEPRVMSAIDMIELKRLSSPRLSPDGRYLLYKRSRTDWDINRIVRRFVLLDLVTGEEVPAPNPEKEERSAGSAWWSSDSKSILFSKDIKDAKTTQIFKFDIASGLIEQMTNHGSSVSDVITIPNEPGFFFTAPEQSDPLERFQEDEGWKIDAYDSPSNRELWKFDAETASADPILFGETSMRTPSVSRDARTIVFTETPDHRRQTQHLGEVYSLDLETNERVRWTQNDYRENGAKLSPDGSKIAYIADVNAADEPYYEDKVFVVEKNGQSQRLLADMAMEALAFDWDASGTGLFILGNTGLSADLYHFDLASGALRQITEGEHNVSSWSYIRDVDAHVAQIQTEDSPGEIFILRRGEQSFEQVTHEYEDWSKSFLLPEQEAFSWTGRGDVEIEGLLVYPVGYDPDVQYPLVTITHGGPRSSSTFGSWNTSRYVAVLAGQGYMVLLPNHRGGTGYGDEFVRDMFGGYFQHAHHDVMDGIDALIERGLVDPDRLIKMGWSAGGHMVNKLITHTDRFKAASSGAGASDWLSMHGESDVRRSRSFVFGGMPWAEDAPLEQYELDSPLRRAWKASTPTLFFVGENDVRVPPTQSIMMHRGVAATGTPTKLYQADGEPHNYRKPSHQLFKINTELAWYAKYALGEIYDPVLPEAASRLNKDEDETEKVSESVATSSAPD